MDAIRFTEEFIPDSKLGNSNFLPELIQKHSIAMFMRRAWGLTHLKHYLIHLLL